MADTRYIICAAGQQSRWNYHTGTSKHMALIRGEPIIHRTIRLLREGGAGDVQLIAFDPLYACLEVQPTFPRWESVLPDTGIGISKHLWSTVGRTTVIFGDVWFSDAAIRPILSEQRPGTWWFGRSSAGKFSHRWQELFALTFMPEDQAELLDKIALVRQNRERFGNPRAGGWFVYRALNGIQIDKHEIAGHWTEIDDETNDFDFPEDYDNWIARFGNVPPH